MAPDDNGNIFTVYDWKATSLFDDYLEPGDEESAISPDDFWRDSNPVTLNIGGKDKRDVKAFKTWLQESIR